MTTDALNSPLKKVLYLPSTPLNLLLSVAHAVHYAKQQRAQLILIDQKKSQNNLYINALQNWPGSPFESVNVCVGEAKGLAKLAERKTNFIKLAEWANAFKPDAIAVGSDRRIEFQFLMHCMSQQKSALESNGMVEGWYLDDGLYSYAGRPHHWLKDGVNSLIKKLLYGLWWQEPITVGASPWINQAWLFRPEQAVMALQSKQAHLIHSEWFTAPLIQTFSQQVCQCYGLEGEALNYLNNLDVLMLIPHPNNLKKMPRYAERIQVFLQHMRKQNKRVAIKYHPRSIQSDALQLTAQFDVQLVPASLAFEFVLPFLPKNCLVLGDVGTSLLTAQWLRRDLRSMAVLSEDSQFEMRFKPILKSLNVQVLPDYERLFAWVAKS
jgi:hypothetical protein